MSLTEQKNIDKIEIVGATLQIREKNTVFRDLQPIAETFHRYVLVPGSDLTGQPDNVVAIANATWTPQVVEAFNNRPNLLPCPMEPVPPELVNRTNTLGN